MRHFTHIGIAVGVVLLLSGHASQTFAQRRNVVPDPTSRPVANKSATDYLERAEALRDMGSAEAKPWYEKAIEADPGDARTRFAYGEYLRQFRGPDVPMLPKAGEQYLEALRLLQDDSEETDDLRERIRYGMMQLFERDGIALLHWFPAFEDGNRAIRRPAGFFSSQIEVGDQEIPIRDLTSSLLFAEAVLGSPLTDAERSALLRSKPVTDWVNRARYRPRTLPWVDAWWQEIRADDALADPATPGDFFDYEERVLGIAVERTFDAYPWFDASVRVGYRDSTVTAVRDDGPDQEETGSTLFGALAVSRIFPGILGPNRLLLDVQHEATDIEQTSGPQYHREGAISGASLKYSIYPRSTLDRFVLRSSDFDIGIVKYAQDFGDVEIDQYDTYAGISLRQIPLERFDFYARATFMEEEKKNSEDDWNHKQMRLSFTPLWRVSDNENSLSEEKRRSSLRTVNVFLPLDHTEATEGPSDFNSRGYGIGLTAKVAYPGTYQATFLLSAHITYRDYFELGDSETLWTVSARMGF